MAYCMAQLIAGTAHSLRHQPPQTPHTRSFRAGGLLWLGVARWMPVCVPAWVRRYCWALSCSLPCPSSSLAPRQYINRWNPSHWNSLRTWVTLLEGGWLRRGARLFAHDAHQLCFQQVGKPLEDATTGSSWGHRSLLGWQGAGGTPSATAVMHGDLCQPHVARRLSLQVTTGLEQGFPGVGCVCAIQAEGGGLISAPFQNESSSSAPSWGVNPWRMRSAVHGRNSCLTPAMQLTPELWALINLFWEQDFICNCTCKERLEVL